MKNIAAIILAAGKGERMKSEMPKVLHPICGRPMLEYVLDLVRALRIDKRIVILGHQHKTVRKSIAKGINIVIQKRLLGTADAVRCAMNLLRNFKGSILVLYADHPLFKRATIENLIRQHIKNNLDVTLLTAIADNPSGYGRILRDRYGSICAIVEEAKANDFQKEIKEVNLGAACFNKEKLFTALKYIKRNNPKREYYLTDTVGILYKRNAIIEALRAHDTMEALGINNYSDLIQANRLMQRWIHEGLINKGVKIFDPDSTFIDWGVGIGKDTVIYPFTIIERDVKIGKNCSIGPFCHLRPRTVIRDNVTLGNFVEVSRSHIGKETLIKHFSYLGDSRVGEKVNIGAGTVTANFDGKKKNITIIKDRAFIGSDTVLIAPVEVGRSAVTGAGAVVIKNKNVPDGKVAVGVPAKILNKGRRG